MKNSLSYIKAQPLQKKLKIRYSNKFGKKMITSEKIYQNLQICIEAMLDNQVQKILI